MIDFDTLARQVHKERKQQEYLRCQSLEYRSQAEYNHFVVVCSINNKQPSESEFKAYCKENEIDFWIKKKIGETYFGYIYKWDNDKKKWRCRKSKKALDLSKN